MICLQCTVQYCLVLHLNITSRRRYIFVMCCYKPLYHVFIYFQHYLKYLRLRLSKAPTDNVSLRPHVHGVPVEGNLSGPVAETFMVFTGQHHVPTAESKCVCVYIYIYIESLMSYHLLLNLLHELANMILCEALPTLISFLPTNVINLVINDNEFEILFIT